MALDESTITTTPLPGSPQTVVVPDPAAPKRTAETDTEWAIDKLRARREDGVDTNSDPADYVYPNGRDGERDPNRPFYKNTDEAHEARKQQAAESRAHAEWWEGERRAREERAADADIAATRQGPAEDKQRFALFQQITANWDTRAQAFDRDVAAARSALDRLAQTDPAAAHQAWAQVGPKLHAHQQQLLDERARIQQTGLAWANSGAVNNLAANIKSVAKDIPGVRGEEEREELIAAIARRGASSKTHVREIVRRGLNATDPLVREQFKTAINQELQISEREKQQERERDWAAHVRQLSKDRGVAWKEGGIDSLEGLRQEMIRTGSPRAAEAYHIAKQKYWTAKKQGRL